MSEEEDKAKELLAQGEGYAKVEKETGIKYTALRKLRKTWKDEKQQIEADASKTQAEFSVEEAPAPIKSKGAIESALDSLKSGLGIKDSAKSPTPLKNSVIGVKLSAKQQAFVDATSPTVALGLITLAGWAWGHMGEGYAKYLAPNEDVALRIVTPLLRIYARHQTFLVEINPDMADVGASVFALVAYINASYRMYEEIREHEKETGKVEYPRRDGQYESFTSEDELDGTGDRRPPVSRRDRSNASTNGANDGNTKLEHRSDLTYEQTRQYAALLRLSALDYEHRARRSGRFR